MTGSESAPQPGAEPLREPGAEAGTEAVPLPPEPVPPPSADGPPPPSASRSTPPAIRIAGAWVMLAILFGFHFLESVDRWLLPAVLPHIHHELKLSDAEAGWLTSVLLVSFGLASPVIGYFADSLNRRRLLAMGVAVWGLATMWTGLASSYSQLETARAFAGIGGAAIGVIGLSLLMDAFPRQVRSRIVAAYFLAMPLGAAVGLITGTYLAREIGWQIAFLATGSLGVFSALAAFLLPEPVRGASEGIDETKLRLHELVGASQEDYIDLMVNSSYTYSVFGLTFSAFAIGGLSYWLPVYLAGMKRMEPWQSTTGLGLVSLAAAVVGMGLGAAITDRLARINLRALFLVPALAVFLAIPCFAVVLAGQKPAVILTFVFLTECLLWVPAGPCNAIIADVAMPNMRAAAYAAAFCAGHFLGDIWSPSLMGWAVETFGQSDSMATPFGSVLAAIGAVPVRLPGRDPENLGAGMLLVFPAMLIASGVLVAGSRHLTREMALMIAKLRAAPSRYTRPRPRTAPSTRR